MGEDVPIDGSNTVKVSYNQQEKELDLLMVQGSGPSLLGRDWLKVLHLDWSRLHQITQTPDKWCEVVDHHAEVFKEELGRVQGVKVKIHMDSQAKPRFIQPLNVPYALKGKVENELDHLEKEAVIENIQSSDRAALIVPVVKHDSPVRICGITN